MAGENVHSLDWVSPVRLWLVQKDSETAGRRREAPGGTHSVRSPTVKVGTPTLSSQDWKPATEF